MGDLVLSNENIGSHILHDFSLRSGKRIGS